MNLRDIPIQRKLTTIIMLTTSMVLTVTCVAFAAYEIFSFRKSLIQEMETTAEVIAANSTAAVAFSDEGASSEILSALKAEDSVIGAALYTANGGVLAAYPVGSQKKQPKTAPSFVGYKFDSGGLIMVQPVERAGTRIGTFYLKSDLREIYERLRLYAGTVFLVFAGSFFMAFLMSKWLQRSISKPILELAKTARAVTERKDYSVRARKLGADELGMLTDSFNDMLGQIDARDAELLASRKRLQLALSASQTGTWDWDLHQRVIHFDEFTGPLFGIKNDAFDGNPQHLIELFHPADRAAVGKAVAAAEQGASFRAEGRVTWPDGSEHHLALRGTAVSDPLAQNQAKKITGVCLDITDRKRAEERIRKMNTELEERVMLRTAELTASHQEMEAFTYSVSHDLRAPLRHIIAFAEILQDEFGTELSEPAMNYLSRIRRGAQSMSQLVDDLLNLARIGRQGLSLQWVDLNEILHEVVNELQPELMNRRIEWHIEDLPSVQADPGLIRQVFANLISNAVKYTRPKSDALIEVGAEDNGEETVIFVRDNGVGFNMKFSDKLFGVFQRLHSSDAFEGTGVGLALVERIVRKHGGKVWANSEMGKGAEFYFALPHVNAKAAAQHDLAIAGVSR